MKPRVTIQGVPCDLNLMYIYIYIYIYTFGSAYEKFGFLTRPNTRLVHSQIFWKCYPFLPLRINVALV